MGDIVEVAALVHKFHPVKKAQKFIETEGKDTTLTLR
jgi:hypothetical protein